VTCADPIVSRVIYPLNPCEEDGWFIGICDACECGFLVFAEANLSLFFRQGNPEVL